MTMLKSAHSKHKVKFLVFIKIVTFIILSWIYPYNNDENALSTTLENGNNFNISLNIRTHRLLAKYEFQNEVPSKGIQNKVSHNRDYYKLEKGKGNNNTFEKLKQVRSNHMDEYLKIYKNRYSKKRGLKKLDCYYEKVLFNSFNKLNKIIEHKNVSMGRINRFLCTKYGIPFILLSLVPLLAFAMPGITVGKVHSQDVSTCKFTLDPPGGNKLKTLTHVGCKYDDLKAFYLKYIILIILVVIVLSLIIYTYIKILKYKRIQSGMLK